jgi:hypothetical protein
MTADPSLMLTNYPIIHFHGGRKFMFDVVIDQDELDAINALMHWLDGFSAGSSRAVPGHYELSMVYSRLRASYNANARQEAKINKSTGTSAGVIDL